MYQYALFSHLKPCVTLDSVWLYFSPAPPSPPTQMLFELVTCFSPGSWGQNTWLDQIASSWRFTSPTPIQLWDYQLTPRYTFKCCCIFWAWFNWITLCAPFWKPAIQNRYPIVPECTKHPPDSGSREYSTTIIIVHDDVTIIFESQTSNVIWEIFSTRQHVFIMRWIVHAFLNVEKLGPRNPMCQKLFLRITIFIWKVPRSIQDSKIFRFLKQHLAEPLSFNKGGDRHGK